MWRWSIEDLNERADALGLGKDVNLDDPSRSAREARES
jgi:hypothetical protein